MVNERLAEPLYTCTRDRDSWYFFSLKYKPDKRIFVSPFRILFEKDALEIGNSLTLNYFQLKFSYLK